jgi:hypothetical protein
MAGNGQLESVSKEPVGRIVRYYPNIWEDELRGTTKTLSKDSPCPDRGSNTALLKQFTSPRLRRWSQLDQEERMIYCVLKNQGSVVDRGYWARS